MIKVYLDQLGSEILSRTTDQYFEIGAGKAVGGDVQLRTLDDFLDARLGLRMHQDWQQKQQRGGDGCCAEKLADLEGI